MANPRITNSIQAVQQATLTGDVIKHSGAGKAYQSVAQTSAIAIQDAADQMRNMNTLGTTAIGVALSQMLATGQVDPYKTVISEVQTIFTNSAENFKNIGDYSAGILKSFPDGD